MTLEAITHKLINSIGQELIICGYNYVIRLQKTSNYS